LSRSIALEVIDLFMDLNRGVQSRLSVDISAGAGVLGRAGEPSFSLPHTRNVSLRKCASASTVTSICRHNILKVRIKMFVIKELTSGRSSLTGVH